MRSMRALLKKISLVAEFLWTHYRNRIDHHPKFGSDVRTEDALHIHRRYEKFYYLHNKALAGEQGGFPKLVKKWLVRAKKGDWHEVFIVVRAWLWAEGSCARERLASFESSAGAKRMDTQSFIFPACPDEDHTGQREVKK